MAAVPGDAIHLVAAGRIGAAQSWSVGVWVGVAIGPGAFLQANLQSVVTDWNTYMATWWAATKVFCSSDTDWRSTTGYFFPSNVPQASLVAASSASGTIPGTSTGYLPTQASVVSSLRTATAGRTGRGRRYLPCTAVALQSNHQLLLTQCAVISAAEKALFDSINAYTSVPNNITNALVIVRSAAAQGIRAVRSVVVDSEVDVQRRRSNKIVAAFTSTANLV